MKAESRELQSWRLPASVLSMRKHRRDPNAMQSSCGPSNKRSIVDASYPDGKCRDSIHV
jgi:hypothetical protein